MTQPPPPRPDVPPARSDGAGWEFSRIPVAGRIPAGGLVVLVMGFTLMASVSMKWWRAALRVTLAGRVTTRVLGDMRASDTWLGVAIVGVGLVLAVSAAAAMGTRSPRTRRTLGAAAIFGGACAVALGIFAIVGADDLVASRVSGAISRESVGRLGSILALEARVGSEASVATEGRPLLGALIALSAAVVAVCGGAMLVVHPGGVAPAAPPGST